MAQFVYGKNVVKQVLSDKTQVFSLVMCQTDAEIEKLANKKGVRVERIDKGKMEKLTGTTHHQGVAAKIEDYKMYSLDEVLSDIPSSKNGLLVMLDELEDPHNLGAILRTCDCVGVDGVIIKKNNAVGLTPTVAKVSAGAIDMVKVVEVTNLTQTLKLLKEKGYWVVGTAFENAVDYRSLKYDTPIVMIIGSEGKGLSRLVKEECDHLVKLPMVGKITSLNASVAAGILLYEVYNKKFPL